MLHNSAIRSVAPQDLLLIFLNLHNIKKRNETGVMYFEMAIECQKLEPHNFHTNYLVAT